MLDDYCFDFTRTVVINPSTALGTLAARVRSYIDDGWDEEDGYSEALPHALLGLVQRAQRGELGYQAVVQACGAIVRLDASIPRHFEADKLDLDDIKSVYFDLEENEDDVVALIRALSGERPVQPA